MGDAVKIDNTALLSQAVSYPGIQAGIAALDKVLEGPSFQAVRKAIEGGGPAEGGRAGDWPAAARTLLVLGLHHPADDPRLDWWERGDTWGNRRLRKISGELRQWVRQNFDRAATPLPYHVEDGGVFLKDAAALSGLGVIGRNNLLVSPQWGPRIRLRAILLEGEWRSTAALDTYAPCEACKGFCRMACPVKAFPAGRYRRPVCSRQMNTDVENQAALGEIGENGKQNTVITYCRACELSCPVGRAFLD